MTIQNQSLPSALWLWAPLLAALSIIAVEALLTPGAIDFLMSEAGPYEIGQELTTTVAFFVGLSALRMLPSRRYPWLAAWLMIAIIACFYITGEEISWGQWIFHWQTPETWSKINYQGETNLHNTSRLFNQIPRRFLEAGMYVGGIIIPGLLKYRPSILPPRLAIIYPNGLLTPTALLYVCFALFSTFGKHVIHVKMLLHPSEVTEVFMYWFVLLYLLMLRRRIIALRNNGNSAGSVSEFSLG